MSPRAAATKAQLSTIQLGTGLARAGILIVGVSAVRLYLYLDRGSVHPLILLAWAVLGATVLGIVLWLRHTTAQLSARAFAVIATALLTASALDFAGVWLDPSTRVYATASVAVGGVFLALSTLRGTGELAIADGLLAGGFLITVALQMPLTPSESTPQIFMAAMGLGPLTIGIVMVWRYRTLVTQALDRVLLRGALEDPGVGPGSSERDSLALLDREVEELFDDVASGREPLPLSEARARRAGELAGELRAHLVAGRMDTWLAHAISESDVLRGVFRVSDPEGHAALLDPDQRDGLLTALWLLAATQGEHYLRGTISVSTAGSMLPPTSLVITVTVDGLSRLAIEPATWPGLDRLGRYGVTSTASGMRIDIRTRIR